MKNLTLLIKPASSLCNMRCEYCFYADVSARRSVMSHGIMTDEVLRTLTRKALISAEESVSFVFQGGEPTLAGPDFYRRAVGYQERYNDRGIAIYNSIQTNGVSLNREWTRFFRENKFLVGVSLDGYQAVHDKYRRLSSGEGSYGRVLEGIKLLGEEGVQFNILSVVTADAARAPREVYRALRGYGYLQFIPLIDSFCGTAGEYSLNARDYGSFLTETFDEYYRDIMRGEYVSVRDFDGYVNMLRGMPPPSCAMQGRCGGYFTLEADGSVYPCDFYVTDSYRIGSITEQSFEELAATERAADFISTSVRADGRCLGCKWRPLCRGGCRRYREPFPSLSKLCGAYERFFEECFGKIKEIAARVNRLSGAAHGGKH